MALQAEPELLWAQRAFPQSQELLRGSALRSVGSLPVGWHDTHKHPLAGAFAIVGDGAGYDDLIGKVLRVANGSREVFVWVVGARSIPVPLSLSRRAFFSLGLLAYESLLCTVEVVG